MWNYRRKINIDDESYKIGEKIKIALTEWYTEKTEQENYLQELYCKDLYLNITFVLGDEFFSTSLVNICKTLSKNIKLETWR